MEKQKIDFVILWVDGSDKKWLEEKKKYNPNLDINDSIIRFRDWDNLKYWFRGVEKFASWVNKIYFITYGHLPSFLNTNNKKLVVVNHKDFMKQEYLPTYNSNAIDINLHKIKELSEKFIYFNDDFFIIDKIKPSDFFENDMTKDEYAEVSIIPNEEVFSHILLNNTYFINKHFNKMECIKKNMFKYYNLRYGLKNIIRTLNCAPHKKFSGFYNPHIAQAFFKSDFFEIWNLEKEVCERTSKSRFRSKEDISQYLIRNYRLASGKFIPRNYKFSKYFEIGKNNKRIIDSIINQKYKIICLNDVDTNVNFEKSKNEINSALGKILPEKSSFER